MDGTLANYNGFMKRVVEADAAGKKTFVFGILPDIERAWGYVLKRKEETGRGIDLDGFLVRHLGSIDTMIKVLQENPEITVYLKDTRNITNKEEARAAEFISDPKQILDILSNLRYNKILSNRVFNQLMETKTKKIIIKHSATPEERKAMCDETNRIARKPEHVAKLVNYLKATGQIKE